MQQLMSNGILLLCKTHYNSCNAMDTVRIRQQSAYSSDNNIQHNGEQ